MGREGAIAAQEGLTLLTGLYLSASWGNLVEMSAVERVEESFLGQTYHCQNARRYTVSFGRGLP